MNTSTEPTTLNRSGAAPRLILLALACIGTLGLFSTLHIEAEDEAGASVDTSSVPEELIDALTPLDNNWQSWSDGVAADLAALYNEDPGNTEALRKHIDKLEKRLAVVEKALGDSSYRSIHKPLRNLYGKMNRRISVVDAALDTLTLGPEARAARMDQYVAAVKGNLSDLESYLNSLNNGGGWLTFLNTAKVEAALSQGETEITAALNDLMNRFEAAESDSDPAVQEFVARDKFQALKSSASDLLEFAGSGATTANADNTGDLLLELVTSLDAYEAEPNSASAAQVRKAHEALRTAAIDGGARMEEALRNNYFNYNVRFFVSEALINRFVSEARNETGPVVDFILGAHVRGNQVTATEVSFDLKPDARNARFNIRLAGRVNSNTRGMTDQATIFTHGTHYFWADKPIIFDGYNFSTEPATISVNANNRTVGARTKVSGLPILGGIADNIAVGEARKRKGQSEAIARGRVSSRVLPRLNEEANKEFATANADLRAKLDDPLKELGLYPDAKSFRTTDTQMTALTRLMGSGELGADSPYATPAPANGAVVQVHESWINNSIDRMELAGRTINEDELKTLLETRLKKLLGDDFKFPVEEKEDGYEDDGDGPATFIFADQDPIRVEVADSKIVLRMRAGIQQPDDEDIPTQNIRIELKFSIDGDNIQVERDGGIRVVPVDTPDSRVQQLAYASVIRGIFQRATPPRTFKRTREVKYKEKVVPLKVSHVEALDGWVTVEVE